MQALQVQENDPDYLEPHTLKHMCGSWESSFLKCTLMTTSPPTFTVRQQKFNS